MADLSVFEYSNYRAFLGEWFVREKAKSGFSYAKFAERAGFESRSYLRLIITNRRNLSAAGLEKCILGLRLEGREAQGFRFLVQANQATTIEERLRNWEEFLVHRPRSKNTQLLRDSFEYLSRFINPVLKVLLSQDECRDLPVDELAKILGISTSIVDEALANLRNLGLLRVREDGRRFVSENLIATMDDVPNVAIQSFHKNALTRAIESIERPVAERELQSVIVALNQDGFDHLKTRLRQVADEIDQLYGGCQPGVEKIYVCNLNLIPVTNSVIRNSAEDESDKVIADRMSVSDLGGSVFSVNLSRQMDDVQIEVLGENP